jgi:hypothetical protein
MADDAPALKGIMSVFHDELSKRGTNCVTSRTAATSRSSRAPPPAL